MSELRSRPSIRSEVEEFLYREADLLDRAKLTEWLELLTDDVRYRVPVRMTREKGADEREFSDTTFHFDDDRATLEMKVERLEKDHAWSENPPSRLRRIVGNVRVDDVDDAAVTARSNFHLHRGKGDDPKYDFLTGERRDVLRRRDDGLRLADRTVYLDQTVLGTNHLSIFF